MLPGRPRIPRRYRRHLTFDTASTSYHDGVPMTSKNRSSRAFTRAECASSPTIPPPPPPPSPTHSRSLLLRRRRRSSFASRAPTRCTSPLPPASAPGRRRIETTAEPSASAHATQRPHVHRAGVRPVGHDHLGRAVARRRDDAGEHLLPRERAGGRRRRRRRGRRGVEARAFFLRALRRARVVERRHRVVAAAAAERVEVFRALVRRRVPAAAPRAARQAKVAHLHDAAAEPRAPAQQIRGLDVSVPHPDVVHVLDRRRELLHERAHLSGAHLASNFVQIPALRALEDHVEVYGHRHERERRRVHARGPRAARGVKDAVDLDDVRMVEPVQDDDLSQDPLRVLERAQRVRDALHRDHASREDVSSFAHRAETSVTEHGDQAVPRPGLPRLDDAVVVRDVVRAILRRADDARVRGIGFPGHPRVERPGRRRAEKVCRHADAALTLMTPRRRSRERSRDSPSQTPLPDCSLIELYSSQHFRGDSVSTSGAAFILKAHLPRAGTTEIRARPPNAAALSRVPRDSAPRPRTRRFVASKDETERAPAVD
eukprot:30259-Pelagococcus_subviridis.AAC.2